jgi:hypothetical protein
MIFRALLFVALVLGTTTTGMASDKSKEPRSAPTPSRDAREKQELQQDICGEYAEARMIDCPPAGERGNCVERGSRTLGRLVDRWYDRYHEHLSYFDDPGAVKADAGMLHKTNPARFPAQMKVRSLSNLCKPE